MRTATLNGTLCVLLMTVAVATARAAPDPALVGWWRLDAGQGTAIRDLSGNGNDGTVVGARWRKAARGSELFFDGAGDYVDCGQSPALAGLTDDFSVLAWVKLDGGATEVSNFYVAENETYHQNGFMMRVDGALGKLTIRGSSKGRNGAGFSQRIVPQDRWCMVGMSVHDRQGTMYVDGERDLTHALGEIAPATGAFTISQSSQSFLGAIAEVKVFTRALNGEEMLALYRADAANYGHDTSWFGKVRIRPFYYEDAKSFIAEADFRGIVPLAAGAAVRVELAPAQGAAIKSDRIETLPVSLVGDYTFDLSALKPGAYEVRLVYGAPGSETTQRVTFEYPAAPPVAPDPERETVPPPARPDPCAFKIEPVQLGGMILHIGGRRIAVESSFSYPRGGDNVLACNEASSTAEAGWKPAIKSVGENVWEVWAEGASYRLVRTVRQESHRVLVSDMLTHLGAESVGIVMRHDVRAAGAKKGWIAGSDGRVPAESNRLQINPTIFLGLSKFGLGLVALDDVFVVQSEGGWSGKGSFIGTRTFAFDEGRSYTFEWAIYPTTDPEGYYDFINAIRRDEGRNHVTVTGGFAGVWTGGTRRSVPPIAFFRIRGAKHALIPCLASSADDPDVSLEGVEFVKYPKETALLKDQVARLRALDRDMKVMFHIAHNLYANNTPRAIFPGAEAIHADGAQHHFGDMQSHRNYFSAKRIEDNWRWWCYVPTLENSFGKALLDAVDVKMDEIGCNAAFMDGFFWPYAGDYTYNAWDGYTAEIDPASRTITRTMASTLLLSQDAMVAFVKKMVGKGGTVVANNVIVTRTMGRLPMITDKEITEGAYVHLAQTPITMGNPAGITNEVDVYKDVLAKLRWGNLYMYYGEGMLTHPSLPAQMYPITVEEIGEGIVKGRERLVTMNSGIYGWPEPDLHCAWRYDARGRMIPAGFVTTVARDGVRTRVALDRDESCALARVPVRLGSETPLNLVLRRYDERGVGMVINGRGPVTLTLRDGTFGVKAGRRYKAMVAGKDDLLTLAAGDDGVSFALTLDGMTAVAISAE